MDELKKGLGEFLLATLKSIYGILSCGFLTFKTYHWFITPVFPLPDISYTQAVGIMMFVFSIRTSIPRKLKPEYYKDSEDMITSMHIVAPWIILGICWIVKLFI